MNPRASLPAKALSMAGMVRARWRVRQSGHFLTGGRGTHNFCRLG